MSSDPFNSFGMASQGHSGYSETTCSWQNQLFDKWNASNKGNCNEL